jgi:hypothetical protein
MATAAIAAATEPQTDRARRGRRNLPLAVGGDGGAGSRA